MTLTPYYMHNGFNWDDSFLWHLVLFSVWRRWVFNAPCWPWMLYLLHCSEKLGDCPCFSALWSSNLHKSVFCCCPSKYDGGHVLMCCPLLWNLIWWCVIHYFENKRENAFKLSDACFNSLMIWQNATFWFKSFISTCAILIGCCNFRCSCCIQLAFKIYRFNFKTASFHFNFAATVVS